MDPGLGVDAVSMAAAWNGPASVLDDAYLSAVSAPRRRAVAHTGVVAPARVGRGHVIEKTPNGRFRARLKSGRQFVASRTFDTKREASDWLAR